MKDEINRNPSLVTQSVKWYVTESSRLGRILDMRKQKISRLGTDQNTRPDLDHVQKIHPISPSGCQWMDAVCGFLIQIN